VFTLKTSSSRAVETERENFKEGAQKKPATENSRVGSFGGR